MAGTGFNDTSRSQTNKPLRKGLVWLISIAGAVFVLIMALLLINLFREPEITNLRSLSALDDSVLVEWKCTKQPDHYLVEYRTDASWQSIEVLCHDTIIPLRNLPDCSKVDVTVTPVYKGERLQSETISIPIPEHGSITSVTFTVNRTGDNGAVTQITEPVAIDACTDTIDLAWEYEGQPCGFNVYLDPQTYGTEERLPFVNEYIEAGAEQVCHIDNLSPGTRYTLSIIPDVGHPNWYERTIITADFEDYAGQYGYTTYGAVLASASNFSLGSGAADAINIEAITKKWTELAISEIKAGENYQIALILEGMAVEHRRECIFAAYAYNESGDLMSCGQQSVDINSVGTDSPRVLLRPFAAPGKAGEYTIVVTIDGKIVDTRTLTVIDAE